MLEWPVEVLPRSESWRGTPQCVCGVGCEAGRGMTSFVVTIDSVIDERPKHDPERLTRTTVRSMIVCTKAWGIYVQAAGALPIVTPDVCYQDPGEDPSPKL